MPINKNFGHIPPHRVWAFVRLEGELRISEHDHIAWCEYCFRLFQYCSKSDSFDSLLKEFAEDTDERRSA
jgi:hypothetical protein